MMDVRYQMLEFRTESAAGMGAVARSRQGL